MTDPGQSPLDEIVEHIEPIRIDRSGGEVATETTVYGMRALGAGVRLAWPRGGGGES